VLTEKVTYLNMEVQSLQKLMNQIGSPSDSEQLRKQLRIKREDCATHSKATLQLMKKFTVERADRPKYDRIVAQFNDIFEKAQKLATESIQKERITPIPVRVATEEPEIKKEERIVDDDVVIKRVEFVDHSVDSAIIEERTTDIKYLENELRGLNEMFVDIASMLKEQQEGVNQIEDDTNSAVVNTEAGVNDLKAASESSSSYRSKLCCLALIITLIVAALILFFGIWLGVIKK